MAGYGVKKQHRNLAFGGTRKFERKWALSFKRVLTTADILDTFMMPEFQDSEFEFYIPTPDGLTAQTPTTKTGAT